MPRKIYNKFRIIRKHNFIAKEFLCPKRNLP